MATNYNFQEIWNKKNTDIPNIKEIKEKANSYRKKQIRGTIFQIFSLCISTGMIIWVWFRFPDLNILTKSGMILIFIALSMYIFQNFQKINIISKINPSVNNQEYLQILKILQKKNFYMQTKGITIYYIILSLGMALYLFEFVMRMSLMGGILTYGLIFLWIVIVWIFIRPKQIKKQRNKLNTVINSLESLEKGFEE